MAHKCPDCGQMCYCGGDCDDCLLNAEEDVRACTHCRQYEPMDEDDEDFDGDFEEGYDDGEDDEPAPPARDVDAAMDDIHSQGMTETDR